MKAVVIGTGYVGLVSGTCLAALGHEVVCVDIEVEKIKLLTKHIIPFYEPSLAELVKKHYEANRLSFTTNLADALNQADMVILAVGTPSDPKTGRAHLGYLFDAAKSVISQLTRDVIMVTKSTVPVGTGVKLQQLIKEADIDYNVDVVSNPEFLREGSAVHDFMHPDRLIVGSFSDHGKQKMQQLYQPLIDQGIPVLFTNTPSAELIKYASNAYLAMKIAFTNEIADICEGCGGDVNHVLKGMGMDQRIGGQYMQPGPGFGGSCFPKDTLAFTHIARDVDFPTRVIEAVIKSNDNHKLLMAKKIIAACNGDVNGKTISLLGLTFKANTDDTRESPSLVIMNHLLKAGARLRAYDPMGIERAQQAIQHDKIYWANSTNDAATGGDALVILTEWDAFQALDLKSIKPLLNQPCIIDLRNILSPQHCTEQGFRYLSLGRAPMEAVH